MKVFSVTGFPHSASGPEPTQPASNAGDTRAMTARDVILRDGGTLRLRPPSHDDADALLEFFGRLSPESVYQRFHGALRVTPQVVETFVDPDWNDLGSLIGTLGDDGRIVALAEYARLRDPASAEVAFAVADELQGRGIATRLLEQLAAEAASHGIESFVAEVLAGQPGHAARVRGRWIRRLAPARRPARSSSTSASRRQRCYRERVDRARPRRRRGVAPALLRTANGRGLRRVPATRDRSAASSSATSSTASFAGAAYPVNRTGDPGRGRPRVHDRSTRSRTTSTSP